MHKYTHFCIHIFMCTHTKTCTFHDVYCSKPFTFHNGFMFFLLLVAVSSTVADFKLLQLRPTVKKMSITRSERQQRMCNVWYMIRKGTRSQPDNICHLLLSILSKNKACDCNCHLILIDLPKKNCNRYCSCFPIRNCRLKKITSVCQYFCADGAILLANEAKLHSFLHI